MEQTHYIYWILFLPVLLHPQSFSRPNPTAYFQQLCLSPLLSHPLTFIESNPTAKLQSGSLILPLSPTRCVFCSFLRHSQLLFLPQVGPSVVDPVPVGSETQFKKEYLLPYTFKEVPLPGRNVGYLLFNKIINSVRSLPDFRKSSFSFRYIRAHVLIITFSAPCRQQ